jgi:pimeloyl-ACP methyl ester carboxylesterase
MGLGAFKTAWWRQTRHFGHTHGSTYTSLTFDNRGMGLSSKPLTRYSTSEMARDIVELLEHLGWIPKRTIANMTSPPSTKPQLNIIGVSMGGMIAQELAFLLPPNTISSLILVSTAPRLVNEVGFFRNLRDRINLFIPRDPDTQLDDTKRRLFNPAFLEEPDCDAYVDPATGQKHGWPTNGDRFAAGELRKRQGKFPPLLFFLVFTVQGKERHAAHPIPNSQPPNLSNQVTPPPLPFKPLLIYLFIVPFPIKLSPHSSSPPLLTYLPQTHNTSPVKASPCKPSLQAGTTRATRYVGRCARICVVHGTADGMITFTHAKMLRDAFAGDGIFDARPGGGGGPGDEIQWKVFEGAGHMLPWEKEAEFNALVEEMVDRGNKLSE